MITNPNPEEFVKLVVWNLACLRVELEQVNTKLEMLCEATGVNVSLSDSAREALRASQAHVFLESMKRVGIQPGEGWPPSDG